MDFPDGMDVKVVENADNCVHITMPADPTGSNELSDEELSNAAGGMITAAVGCTQMIRGVCYDVLTG
jgi:mersacidin/lichenicidin family type 2 lantibiotic